MGFNVLGQIAALKTALENAFAARDEAETSATAAAASESAAGTSAASAAASAQAALDAAAQAATQHELSYVLSEHLGRTPSAFDADGPTFNSYVNAGVTGVWQGTEFKLTGPVQGVTASCKIDLVSSPLTNPMIDVSHFAVRVTAGGTLGGYANLAVIISFEDSTQTEIAGTSVLAITDGPYEMHDGVSKMFRVAALALAIPVPANADFAKVTVSMDVPGAETVDGSVEFASSPYINAHA